MFAIGARKSPSPGSYRKRPVLTDGFELDLGYAERSVAPIYVRIASAGKRRFAKKLK
jgi:hypothetical protein